MAYVAHLIRHPGIQFHVLDLAGGIASHRVADTRSIGTQACPRRMRNSERREFSRAVWVMRARCWTIKPKPLTDGGSPSCTKNWKNRRKSET